MTVARRRALAHKSACYGTYWYKFALVNIGSRLYSKSAMDKPKSVAHSAIVLIVGGFTFYIMLLLVQTFGSASILK